MADPKNHFVFGSVNLAYMARAKHQLSGGT